MDTILELTWLPVNQSMDNSHHSSVRKLKICASFTIQYICYSLILFLQMDKVSHKNCNYYKKTIVQRKIYIYIFFGQNSINNILFFEHYEYY